MVLEYHLLGDLNCNLASLQYDSNTRRLCEISDLFGLQQLITEATRITESSSTLIDLIFTNYMYTGQGSLFRSLSVLASAITALLTFMGNYLLLFPQKGIQPFLTEILKILIERVFVTISLSRTGLVTALMILMFCGLTGKRNFWMLLTFMLHSELDALG